MIVTSRFSFSRISVRDHWNDCREHRCGCFSALGFFEQNELKWIERFRNGYSMLRGYHDATGGRVAVTDAKFSEGKNITREDVEEQWRREEAVLRDLVGDKEVDGFYAVGSSCFGIDGASVMDCRMYDLPEGCQVLYFVLLKE